MPPKEELFRPFEAIFQFKIKAELKVIEWKNTEGGLAFRPRGEVSDLLWFIPGFQFSGGLLPDKWDLQWNRHIGGFYEHKSFFRLVPFVHHSLSCESWLVLRPDACGIICGDYKQRANWKANLSWDESEFPFLWAPLQLIRDRVESCIAHDTEEWQRVCLWAQQGDDERFWGLVKWRKGDAIEWKSLVRAAIQIASLQDEIEKEHEWGIFILEKPRFAFGPLQMARGRNKHPTPQRLAPLLELLEKHFRPMIDYSRSSCRWKPPFYSVLRPSHIRGAKPNAHELMEALELWRDFGHKSGQLPEVQAGLRQLLR